jgi:hypothetical protein
MEKERLTLKHDCEAEKQKLIKHHQVAYDQMQNQYQQQIAEINNSYRVKIDDLTKV